MKKTFNKTKEKFEYFFFKFLGIKQKINLKCRRCVCKQRQSLGITIICFDIIKNKISRGGFFSIFLFWWKGKQRNFRDFFRCCMTFVQPAGKTWKKFSAATRKKIISKNLSWCFMLMIAMRRIHLVEFSSFVRVKFQKKPRNLQKFTIIIVVIIFKQLFVCQNHSNTRHATIPLMKIISFIMSFFPSFLSETFFLLSFFRLF